MAARITYHVAPRWSGGSPAQVHEDLARRVVRQELDAHTRALEGFYGEARQREAQEVPYALRGIVQQRIEKIDGWLVLDLLTNEVSYRFAQRLCGSAPTAAARRRARIHILHMVSNREMLALPVADALPGELR